MTTKYQRPVGAYGGDAALSNRSKYQDDAVAVPKRAISSSKIDGDFNYLVDALNQMDDASGSRASIAERLAVSLNLDGTLKTSVTATLDDFTPQASPGSMVRVSDTSFSLSGGNYSGIYTEGRRVRLMISGVYHVADVVSSSYGSGLTTVVVADMVNASGVASVIAANPTEVAYGPLVGGHLTNISRRFKQGITIPVGSNDFKVKSDGTDLVVDRAGSVVARFTASGVVGAVVTGVTRGQLSSDVVSGLAPVGSLMPFAGSAAPSGWLLCAGQAVSRTSYADLFTAIGIAYGTGDGSTTFNVPDLRGRSVFGVDNMNGTDAGRLSASNTLGGTGGTETKSGTTDGHTLTVNEIPSHNHVMQGASGGTTGAVIGYQNGGTASAVTANTGGGAAHSHTISNLDVMPPYMLLNYIIKA